MKRNVRSNAMVLSSSHWRLGRLYTDLFKLLLPDKYTAVGGPSHCRLLPSVFVSPCTACDDGCCSANHQAGGSTGWYQPQCSES